MLPSSIEGNLSVIKETPREPHITTEGMDDDDGSYHQFEALEEWEIDRKIEKTKLLLRNLRLPDGGQKLKILLSKLCDERERRNGPRLQKVSCESEMSVSVQRSHMSDEVDNSQSCLTAHMFSRSASVSSCLSVVHKTKLKPKNSACHRADNGRISSVNAFGDKPVYGSGCNKSTENDQHHRFRCSRQNESHKFYSGREDSYYRPTNCFAARDEHTTLASSQKSRIHRVSSFVREENGCSHLAGKRRSSLSLTPQCLTKRKIATLVVLDEDEDEQPKQQKNNRMSEGWMKDMKIYYPARDHPESVEICYFDMECLAPFSYLSSPIMNFYIRYLQRPESLTIEQRNDYHFFNTYFYNKIDEALYDMKSRENGYSFAKLRRWLKGVNIFEKSYIFLPIHACQHWSLAIICIPAREDEAGPIVLHLDSLGLHTSRTIFENIRSYLTAEWEHISQAEVSTRIPIAERIWKVLPNKIHNKQIQVPQQENDYDCGLFVLFFMERFIEDAPPRLRKTDLDRFGGKWFQPAEASHLRDSIKSLLLKHFNDSNNSSPVVCEELE